MALSQAKKTQLARMAIPSDTEVRDRIHGFIRRSGLTNIEFADAIKYSNSALGQFLNGNYDAHHATDENTLAIRAAAKEYMDIHDFSSAYESRGQHYTTASYKQVHNAALSALAKGTAYVVDGPPGTEKTWSFRQIEKHIRDHKLGRCVYIYARIHHSPQTFLQELCTNAGIPNRGTIDQLIRKLQFFLGGGRTLLIVDEAQHLDHLGLEVLRQLLDLPPFFGVMLGGSHDITQRLSHWQMEQWRSRVRKTIYMNGWSREECHSILRAELGSMSDGVCDATIAQCVSRAVRTEMKQGKAVQVPFDYYSCRLVAGAIEAAKETRSSQPHTQKAGKAA